MNTAAFLVRYPEFSVVDPALIGPVLAEVSTELNPNSDATLYPANFDAVQGALAAHRIWVSPAGNSLRVDDADLSTSPYLSAFKQMVQGSVVVSSPRRGW